jgi:hypothetical protein
MVEHDEIEWQDLLDTYDFDECIFCEVEDCPVEEPEKITKEVER